MHLLQFLNYKNEVQIGLSNNKFIFPLDTKRNLYHLIQDIINQDKDFATYINEINKLAPISYEALKQDKRLLLPIFHDDSSHMIISGTGLTHLNSTILRNTMHGQTANLSDAQKIYKAGLNQGKPLNGKPGARPEWFYKGNGHTLKSCFAPLYQDSLSYGEEAEIVVIYIINQQGEPYRIGFALGNEFSDHGLEKENQYYLAQSKLCDCSIGSEIYIGSFPNQIRGSIKIEREDQIIWNENFSTGATALNHSINNIEHYLFKNAIFRQPGDLHLLFIGADKISYSDNICLKEEDSIFIQADLFNFPLINPIKNQNTGCFLNIKNL